MTRIFWITKLLKIGKAIHISSIFSSGGWAKLKFIYLWYLIGKLWTFTGLRWWYCCQNTSLNSESTRKHYIIKVTHESALQSRHWIPRVIIKQIKVNIKLMFWKSQGIIASYVEAWPCLFYRPAMWVASLGTGKLWLVSQNDCHKDRINVRMDNTSTDFKKGGGSHFVCSFRFVTSELSTWWTDYDDYFFIRRLDLEVGFFC